MAQMSGELNPNLDPFLVGPLTAAVNLYWAVACVPLSVSIWLPGAMVRAGREVRQAWDGRDG